MTVIECVDGSKYYSTADMEGIYTHLNYVRRIDSAYITLPIKKNPQTQRGESFDYIFILSNIKTIYPYEDI